MMLTGPFLSKNWLASTAFFEEADWVIVGLPYDGTASYRPGSRFAPQAIRQASWGLETWSPDFKKDLISVSFFDAGDLELPFGNREKSLHLIQQATEETLNAGKKWFGVGGEHLVTLPVVEAYLKKYPDLAILHFDAHGDLRSDYLGETLSHATVMRRILDNKAMEPHRLVQVGIRSGPEEEFRWMEENKTLLHSQTDVHRGRQRLLGRPVFVTLDLDILDPSVLGGTGTPEPGGFMFSQLIDWLQAFQGLNIVGADVVELSPHYDSSGASSVVAAKVIRELLLLAG